MTASRVASQKKIRKDQQRVYPGKIELEDDPFLRLKTHFQGSLCSSVSGESTWARVILNHTHQGIACHAARAFLSTVAPFWTESLLSLSLFFFLRELHIPDSKCKKPFVTCLGSTIHLIRDCCKKPS